MGSQICIAVNRILVASEVASDFAEALTEATRNLSIDHGIETGVEYGPVLNEAVRERAKQHTDAVARGGRLLVGGRPPKDEALSGGTFFLPTVVAPLRCTDTA